MHNQKRALFQVRANTGDSILDLGAISAIAGLLGVSAKELKACIIEARKTTKANEVQKRLRSLQHLRRTGMVKKALAAYYDGRLASSGLGHYRIAIGASRIDTALATKTEWIHRRVKLDSPCERCTLAQSVKPAILAPKNLSRRYMKWADGTNMSLWNAPIYRLLSLEFVGQALQANFGLIDFFDYLFTYGLLCEEMEEAFVDKGKTVEDIRDDAEALLPLRCRLLGNGQQLLDFPSRLVVGGPDVLVALARPAPFDDFALLIQRRSSQVSGDQGLVAVIPMGYHQHSINSEVEVGLSHTVFREFYEELCGGEEVIKDTARFRPDWFLSQSPALRWFRDNRGAYELTCTAFGISLGPGNAQFAATLAVPNEGFWAAYGDALVTNYEVDRESDGRYIIS